MDILGGSSQNWTIFWVISMHFGFYFLKVKVKNGGGGGGGVVKISNIFWGVLEILDIFWGVNGRCWARAYV